MCIMGMAPRTYSMAIPPSYSLTCISMMSGPGAARSAPYYPSTNLYPRKSSPLSAAFASISCKAICESDPNFMAPWRRERESFWEFGNFVLSRLEKMVQEMERATQ